MTSQRLPTRQTQADDEYLVDNTSTRKSTKYELTDQLSNFCPQHGKQDAPNRECRCFKEMQARVAAQTDDKSISPQRRANSMRKSPEHSCHVKHPNCTESCTSHLKPHRCSVKVEPTTSCESHYVYSDAYLDRKYEIDDEPSGSTQKHQMTQEYDRENLRKTIQDESIESFESYLQEPTPPIRHGHQQQQHSLEDERFLHESRKGHRKYDSTVRPRSKSQFQDQSQQISQKNPVQRPTTARKPQRPVEQQVKVEDLRKSTKWPFQSESSDQEFEISDESIRKTIHQEIQKAVSRDTLQKILENPVKVEKLRDTIRKLTQRDYFGEVLRHSIRQSMELEGLTPSSRRSTQREDKIEATKSSRRFASDQNELIKAVNRPIESSAKRSVSDDDQPPKCSTSCDSHDVVERTCQCAKKFPELFERIQHAREF